MKTTARKMAALFTLSGRLLARWPLSLWAPTGSAEELQYREYLNAMLSGGGRR